MKKSHLIIAALLAVFSLGACVKDQPADEVKLACSKDVVLSRDEPGALALSLNWTRSKAVNTLQFSGKETFESPVEIETSPGSVFIQLTHEKLGSIANSLGLTGGVASPLFIRMKSAVGKAEPKYSNVCSVKVTPVSTDMHFAIVLDSNMKDTGRKLYSNGADGVYSGYLGASEWYNWWLEESNGVVWGNVGSDGGGTPFVLSSNSQHWNFWFPGKTGCYFVTVNTVEKQWSALYIPALHVTGDVSGEMSFNINSLRWSMPFKTEKAGDLNITISGDGKLYNSETGTEDGAAIDAPVSFQGIKLNAESSGIVSITLDLSDPRSWKCDLTQQ